MFEGDELQFRPLRWEDGETRVQSKAVGINEAAEKLCTGQESKTSGAKALMGGVGTARLKPCPDTKHEFFRNL